MKMLRRIHTFFRRKKLASEMAEEMRQHVELQTEQNAKAGMRPDEARDAAQRQFGNIAGIQQTAREQLGGLWLEHLRQDLGYAWRVLRKSPVFTTVTVLSLALGIGAATAIFSLVDAILLKSLPVPDPQELRVLNWSGTDTHFNSYTGTTFDDTPGFKQGDGFSVPAFINLREQCRAQAEIFGYYPIDAGAIARARHEAANVHAVMVSGNFFSGLGVRPLLGHLLNDGDESAGAAPGVVISYQWWKREFDLDPLAIGQPVALNGHSFTIIGILPSGFGGVRSGISEDLYVSLSAQPSLAPYLGGTQPDSWWVVMMARLKNKMSDIQLKAAMETAFRGVAEPYATKPGIRVQDGHDGPNMYRWAHRKELLLLLSIVGIVLLVVCANVAGISLARGENRHHEFAVRVALGAGRGRLMRQSLAESMLLSLLGGGLGILLACWGRTALSRLLFTSTGGGNYDPIFDLKVLSFALAVSMATTLLFGFFPSFKAAQVDPIDGLKERTAISTPRLRVGQFLVAVQIALALLLVTGAGLCVRTLINLKRIDPGFNLNNLLIFRVSPGDSIADFSQLPKYYDNMLRAMSAIPGVRFSTLASFTPLTGMAEGLSFKMSENSSSGASELQTQVVTVSGGYFATMGIPMVLGRELNAADAGGAPNVVVVNESFVHKYFPNENPIGQTLQEMGGRKWQVAGVCRDAKYASIKEPALPIAYIPFRQRTLGSSSFVLRTMLPPFTLAASVRKAVATVDPTIPLTDLCTQEEVRDRAISSERLFAIACGSLAVLALLLSCIGLYGLMAYDVSRRTSEIGIRMALGAAPQQIVLPIMREAAAVVAAGLVVGLALTLAVTTVISANLYEVKATDAATISGSIFLLLGVALIAVWIPARRAAKVDPVVALRTE